MADIRETLAKNGEGKLARVAKEKGVAENKIEEAQDGDDTKAILIELIVEAMKGPGDAERPRLAELGAGKLAKVAREKGVAEDKIEEAQDGDDTKADLIELIVEAMNAVPKGPGDAERPRLAELGAGKLAKVAREKGVAEDKIEEAQDGDDTKADLIELIVEAMNTAGSQLQLESARIEEAVPPRGAGRGQLAPMARRFPRGTNLLELANELADINIDDLIGLDWPQICVVGGQAEGKSTLLSAVVSTQLEDFTLQFLPEGDGMVTRCPIQVQMRQPEGQENHVAKIHRQDAPSGAKTIVCPGAENPTSEQLEEWGNEIRVALETLQDDMVPGKSVTSRKLIVKLTGPRMPNLSLCDLPGLRQDDMGDPIERMVKTQIGSKNAVILAVAPCNTDKDGWVGRGLARRLDDEQVRTVGVITKVDMVYGPGTEAKSQNRNWRQQIAEVLEDPDAEIPYYACYNPPAGESVSEETKREMIAAFGGADKVGNQNLARYLETKLQEHLGTQLPRMLQTISEKHAELTADLADDVSPDWGSVQKLVLTYGRFVQGYLTGDQPTDAKVDQGSPLYANLSQFQTNLVATIKEFASTNTADSMYNHAQAKEGILRASTHDVLTRAKTMSMSPDDYVDDGEDISGKPDRLIAARMGTLLVTQYSGMINNVVESINTKLMPMMKAFFRDIAQIPIEVSEGGKKVYRPIAGKFLPDGTPDPSCLDGYPNLWKRLAGATEDNVVKLMGEVKKNCEDDGGGGVNNKQISTQFMPFESLLTELQRTCTEISRPTTATATMVRVSSAPPRRVQQVELPPHGECQKHRHTFGTYRGVYVELRQPNFNNNPTDNGLMIWDSRGDCQRNVQPKTSSIPDLNGYTVVKDADESLFMKGTHFTIRLIKAGEKYPEQKFGWPNMTDRDIYFTALCNMAAGRPWDKTQEALDADQAAREAEEQAEREREEALAREQAEPEPEPEFSVLSEEFRTYTMPTGDDGDAEPRLARLRGFRGPLGDDDLFSYPFSNYIQLLQENPGDPSLTSPARMTDECRAEAFRIWALKKVMITTQGNIVRVNQQLKSKVLNTKSKHAPFSGFSIFESFRLVEAMEKHHAEELERAKTNATGRRKTPGPGYFLRRNELNPMERKRKEEDLIKLEEIMQKFKAYGIEPPANDALDDPMEDYGY